MASDRSCFRLERLCRSLHEPGHTVLVEPVSFTFDTINLDSISCAGFLPYNTTLCTNQMQDDVYYACLADAANQIALDVVCLDLLSPTRCRKLIFLEGSAKLPR